MFLFRLCKKGHRVITKIDWWRVTSDMRMRSSALRLRRVRVSTPKRPTGPAGLSFAPMISDEGHSIISLLRINLGKLVTWHNQMPRRGWSHG